MRALCYGLLLVGVTGVGAGACTSADAGASPASVSAAKDVTPAIGATPVTPAPYAPDVLLRDGTWTFTPSISTSGRLMAFARWVAPVFTGPDSNIQQLYLARRRADGTWSEPTVVTAFIDARVDDPHFSPDGRWLYLASTRPHPGQPGYPRTYASK